MGEFPLISSPIIYLYSYGDAISITKSLSIGVHFMAMCCHVDCNHVCGEFLKKTNNATCLMQ